MVLDLWTCQVSMIAITGRPWPPKHFQDTTHWPQNRWCKVKVAESCLLHLWTWTGSLECKSMIRSGYTAIPKIFCFSRWGWSGWGIHEEWVAPYWFSSKSSYECYSKDWNKNKIEIKTRYLNVKCQIWWAPYFVALKWFFEHNCRQTHFLYLSSAQASLEFHMDRRSQ